MKACKSILSSLQKHKSSWPFHVPVDPVIAQAPDYYNIIKNPMDLQTAGQKLSAGSYTTLEAFETSAANIVILPQPLIGARDLLVLTLFATLAALLWKEAGNGKPQKRRRPSGTSSPGPSAPTASSVNIPPRTICWEEKSKLSEIIGSLSDRHQMGVIEIIRTGMPQLGANGGEIELDLDALDPVTLAKLADHVSSVWMRIRGTLRRQRRLRDVRLVL
ncbi:hypothetical protein BC829DRAFT_470610 [Chytridium lagenaria]|nr:hypothetical protein BC829DRAFT_470610 [Chytridium lagenaria]